MDRPIRLVQVSAFPVLPASAGGKIRIVKLARGLSKLGVDVTIVAPFHFTQTRALAEAEPFDLIEVPYPFIVPLLFTDRPIPYGALVSYHPGYGTLLRRSLASFDICQLEHPSFVDLAQDLPSSLPLVYDAQNVEYDYTCAESRSRWVRRLAGGRVRRLEAEMVRRADHVFACSEYDLARLGHLYGEPAGGSVLPNGVSLASSAPRRPPPPASGAPRRAVFSGSAVTHNRDAVRTLLTRVAPRLEGEIELVVVGACARGFNAFRRPNVILDPKGTVADYASPDTFGLNPVLMGSGTSLKLLDYLAHGMPVLSTPFGIRGFENLAPYVRVAPLEEFPDILRQEPHPPDGVGKELEAYEWGLIAEDALRVYQELLA